MDMKQQGQFDQYRGNIRSTWGDITDDDVDRSKGNVETLVGTIKEKTGETSDAIREKLNKLFDGDNAEESPGPPATRTSRRRFDRAT